MFYDLMQDNAAGSVVDVIKRHDAGISALQTGSKSYNVVDWAGVRCVRTTTVPDLRELILQRKNRLRPVRGREGSILHLVFALQREASAG